MKPVWLFVSIVTLGFAVQFLSITASHAQVRPEDRPIARDFTNERGFTLDLFNGKLWALAQHPLSPASMSQLGAAVHKAPAPGIQFELLTPGDVGISLHIYW